MNFKHGFDSKNRTLNPDCIQIDNIEVKRLLRGYEGQIKQFLEGKDQGEDEKIIRYLIDCALPHSEHLLPKSHLEKAWDFYNSEKL